MWLCLLCAFDYFVPITTFVAMSTLCLWLLCAFDYFVPLTTLCLWIAFCKFVHLWLWKIWNNFGKYEADVWLTNFTVILTHNFFLETFEKEKMVTYYLWSVCVCVWEREREREKGRQRGGEITICYTTYLPSSKK